MKEQISRKTAGLAIKFRLFVTIGSIALISGCVAPPKQVPIQTKFVGSEHDDYLRAGNNHVTGQAFMRQRGGGTVTCAGERALLLPASAYFKETTAIAARREAPAFGDNKPGAAYAELVRHTRCDAQGNFAFEKVPAGKYLVVSEVNWNAGNLRQGGMLKKEVVVEDGATNRFLLSDADVAR